ncbi:hypothetical protein Back11_09140 [Paenibacillus baekrokdamisoli]|uniref:Uncharacterized protein n=1 Tax=Paenibacillus baekrokdamisoli TaxID=1712516 RepID=A0A3G9J933_9BACL|nr:sugar transferase [Paenibacillus baekrokdamisoli]MBB3067242.1 lipopolysaccharide/colanic/teichoic acid biosynthesis glycosyltransferase [Paenibacillus baekrokdamisoli]BBH19569.1 hypothetical protein Back11_09140 [Paenibacillus baekrokdamisoli]
MKKVAHVCTSGISHKILGDKLTLLQRAGYEVTFISSGDHLDAEIKNGYPFQWRTVPMSRTIQPLQDLRSIWQMRRLMKTERYDVVHTHTAKAGLIGRIAARLAGVPVIIHTSHGLPFYKGQSKRAYTVYRLLEKIGAWFCDALASQNQEDITVMQQMAPWRTVYYEGNGVDLSKLDAMAKEANERLKIIDLKRAYGIREDLPMLLMAARLEPVKDPMLLIEAVVLAKQQGKLCWVTAFAGQGPLESEVRKRVIAEGLEADVVLIGQQTPLAPWLMSADAVTLSSEKEGIPRSLMEAMAYCRPVVATDVLGTRELVVSEHSFKAVDQQEFIAADRSSVTGELVPYRDAGQLSDALHRMMSDDVRRLRYGKAGRQRIECHFTESIVVSRLERMYAETERRAKRARTWSYRIMQLLKRTIDLAVSIPALLLLSPIIALTAFAVRKKLGSPVLFRQKRPGRFGKSFDVFKFRTMTDAVDEKGHPLPDEERLTTFGLWLRKLSLDELPQLLNVINGDMSLVGPRPLLMEYLPLYTQEQARRHDVRPGITGWAQVNGRNAVTWEEKFRLDAWYVEHQSLRLDLKIILMTFFKVFKREGIQQEGHVTMHKFTGSRNAERAS